MEKELVTLVVAVTVVEVVNISILVVVVEVVAVIVVAGTFVVVSEVNSSDRSSNSDIRSSIGSDGT